MILTKGDRVIMFNGKTNTWDIYDYKHRFVIVFTYKCNAKCVHCIVNASPDNHRKMKFITAKNIIESCAKLGLKFCLISGGEVLLFQNELLKLISLCSKFNMDVGIETNCFWACSKDRSIEIVSKLKMAGLTSIVLSTDAFHQPFIPIEKVINAAHAAHSIGLSHMVGMISSGDISENRVIIDKLNNAGICFSTYPINPFGAAANIQYAETSYIDIDQLNDCDEVSFTFLPDNNVIACCSYIVNMNNTSPLYLGNLKINTIEKMYQRYITDKIITSIGENGIKYIMKNQTQNKKQLNRKYRSICEVCLEALSRTII